MTLSEFYLVGVVISAICIGFFIGISEKEEGAEYSPIWWVVLSFMSWLTVLIFLGTVAGVWYKLKDFE